jgi:hypothetical protein
MYKGASPRMQIGSDVTSAAQGSARQASCKDQYNLASIIPVLVYDMTTWSQHGGHL